MNPTRTCIGCSQTDDHPKHQIVYGDDVSVFWHHDCHAIATGDKVSAAIADCGLKGEELRAHIVEHDPGQKVIDAREAAAAKES